ncbi:hypothetical protein QUF63_03295 [Anaerolineales bacterium HSG25]|nr:hypothetical protein [Anaerolineales bacterium HSG25]
MADSDKTKTSYVVLLESASFGVDSEMGSVYTIEMTTKIMLKKQIYTLIESLSVEHLTKLLQFLKELLQPDNKSSLSAPVAPIYQLHHHAIDTGVPDLAENHDHYLYGITQVFTNDHHFEQAGFVRLMK